MNQNLRARSKSEYLTKNMGRMANKMFRRKKKKPTIPITNDRISNSLTDLLGTKIDWPEQFALIGNNMFLWWSARKQKQEKKLVQWHSRRFCALCVRACSVWHWLPCFIVSIMRLLQKGLFCCNAKFYEHFCKTLNSCVLHRSTTLCTRTGACFRESIRSGSGCVGHTAGPR